MTNNHLNDLDDIVGDAEFQLISVIKNHGGIYRFFDENLDDFVKATKREGRLRLILGIRVKVQNTKRMSMCILFLKDAQEGNLKKQSLLSFSDKIQHLKPFY